MGRKKGERQVGESRDRKEQVTGKLFGPENEQFFENVKNSLHDHFGGCKV